MAPKTKKKAAPSKGNAQGSGTVVLAEPIDAHAHAQIQALLEAQAQELTPDLLEIVSFKAASASTDANSVWDPTLPSREPRAGCFGVASASRPCAWTAHTLCERCQVLQTLLLLHSSDSDKAVLAKIYNSTDCSESIVRKKNPAGLPIEVVQMIIDDVVEQFKATKDGAAICKLLHTSCYIRATLVKEHFRPIELFECNEKPHDTLFGSGDDYHVHLPRSVGTYIGDCVEYLALDFSVRKDTSRPPHPSNFRQPVTTFGLAMTTANANLFIRPDTLGCTATNNSTYQTTHDDLVDVDTKTGLGVFQVLDMAIFDDRCAPRDSTSPKRPTYDILRNINPYQRALRGSFAVSTKRGVAFRVTLLLQNLVADQDHEWTRCWSYDTLRVRKGTVVPELNPDD